MHVFVTCCPGSAVWNLALNCVIVHDCICWICLVMWHPLYVPVNFQEVCVTQQSVCMICMLQMNPTKHMTVWNFCILYHFCLHLMYKFHPNRINILVLHSIPLPLYLKSEFFTLQWTLFTGSSVEFDLLWTLICTLCSHSVQCSALRIVSLFCLAISWQRFWWTNQIWQSYERNLQSKHSYRELLQGWWCAARKSLWQGFAEVWNIHLLLTGYCML